MVNLQLGDLVVLIGRNSNKSALYQVVGEDGHNVFLGHKARDDHTRLVLMHGVQSHNLWGENKPEKDINMRTQNTLEDNQ